MFQLFVSELFQLFAFRTRVMSEAVERNACSSHPRRQQSRGPTSNDVFSWDANIFIGAYLMQAGLVVAGRCAQFDTAFDTCLTISGVNWVCLEKLVPDVRCLNLCCHIIYYAIICKEADFRLNVFG